MKRKADIEARIEELKGFLKWHVARAATELEHARQTRSDIRYFRKLLKARA